MKKINNILRGNTNNNLNKRFKVITHVYHIIDKTKKSPYTPKFNSSLTHPKVYMIEVLCK